MTRKLIKPNLDEIKKITKKDTRKKPPPPYKTHAENYYYIKQMNNKTPMVIELIDGNSLRGLIEWYDEKCIKVKKEDGGNCIIFKHFIKCMYKSQSESPREAVEAKGDTPDKKDDTE
jgi:sRNA-binding regulator protein Hfq